MGGKQDIIAGKQSQFEDVLCRTRLCKTLSSVRQVLPRWTKSKDVPLLKGRERKREVSGQGGGDFAGGGGRPSDRIP